MEIDDENFARLKECGEFFELYKVSHFKGYRETKTGETQEVNVEIRDAGPYVKQRYTVIAVPKDGEGTSGNSDESLAGAIAMVHWWRLG